MFSFIGSVSPHGFRQRSQLVTQNLECSLHNVLRGKCTRRFHSENELVILLSQCNSSIQTLTLGIPGALNAEHAPVSIFYLYSLSQFIESVNLSWACLYKLLSLFNIQIPVNLLLINLHYRFLPHLACCHWLPLSMSFSCSLSGNQSHIKLLILAKLHYKNRVFISPLVIYIEYRHYWSLITIVLVVHGC